MLPPRYFKSEIFSRLLPAYFLRRHSGQKVGLASYGASLAWELSEEARNYFEADGGEVSVDTSAKRRWRVTTPSGDSGEMWADGVGGSLLGRGYNLGIIDDPQDPVQVHSALYRSRFASWFPSKWISRQEPGAAIVVVMQRLDPGDAIEFLLAQEDEAPEGWHVVACDEVRSDEILWRGTGDRGLPETCTIEPDPRDVGELLAPNRFALDQVEAIHRSDPHVARAQRQQRPSALTGDFWRAEWFDTYDTLPEDARNGGTDWDTAYTKKERNSASAYVRSYSSRPVPGEQPTVYIEDLDFDWLEFDALANWIRTTDGPHYVEDKASGKSLVQHLSAQGLRVTTVPVTGGDKYARAVGVQPTVAQGRVKVRRALLDRLLRGKHPDPRRNGRQGLLAITAESLATESGDLDLNDVFVQAVNRHTRSTLDYSRI